MAPATLLQQCTSAAVRNLKLIDGDGLGDTPWRLLKPILNRCEDPRMLRLWEQNSPQIQGETGEIWLKLIKRDVPNWRNKPHEPKNPTYWYKVYYKLKKEADLEEREAEELLREKMSKIKRDEDSWKVARPTKAIPERTSRNKGVAMQFQRGSDANGMRFTTGTKTKDFMQSVRRQAAESRLQKSGVLARPTGMLNNGSAPSRIAQAPQHMVEDRQRQADLGRHSTQRGSDQPKIGAGPPMSLAARAAHDLKVREERLRAVREGRILAAQPAPSSAAESRSAFEDKPQTPKKSRTGAPNAQEQSKASKGIAAKPVPASSQAEKAYRRRAAPDERFDDSVPAGRHKRSSTPRKTTQAQSKPMHAGMPNMSSPAHSTATSGVKRKAGPTILLPMKRKKGFGH